MGHFIPFLHLFILLLIIHASIKKGSVLFLDYPIRYKKASTSFYVRYREGLGVCKNGVQVRAGPSLQGRMCMLDEKAP